MRVRRRQSALSSMSTCRRRSALLCVVALVSLVTSPAQASLVEDLNVGPRVGPRVKVAQADDNGGEAPQPPAAATPPPPSVATAVPPPPTVSPASSAADAAPPSVSKTLKSVPVPSAVNGGGPGPEPVTAGGGVPMGSRGTSSKAPPANAMPAAPGATRSDAPPSSSTSLPAPAPTQTGRAGATVGRVDEPPPSSAPSLDSEINNIPRSLQTLQIIQGMREKELELEEKLERQLRNELIQEESRRSKAAALGMEASRSPDHKAFTSSSQQIARYPLDDRPAPKMEGERSWTVKPSTNGDTDALKPAQASSSSSSSSSSSPPSPSPTAAQQSPGSSALAGVKDPKMQEVIRQAVAEGLKSALDQPSAEHVAALQAEAEHQMEIEQAKEEEQQKLQQLLQQQQAQQLQQLAGQQAIVAQQHQQQAALLQQTALQQLQEQQQQQRRERTASGAPQQQQQQQQQQQHSPAPGAASVVSPTPAQLRREVATSPPTATDMNPYVARADRKALYGCNSLLGCPKTGADGSRVYEVGQAPVGGAQPLLAAATGGNSEGGGTSAASSIVSPPSSSSVLAATETSVGRSSSSANGHGVDTLGSVDSLSDKDKLTMIDTVDSASDLVRKLNPHFDNDMPKDAEIHDGNPFTAAGGGIPTTSGLTTTATAALTTPATAALTTPAATTAALTTPAATTAALTTPATTTTGSGVLASLAAELGQLTPAQRSTAISHIAAGLATLSQQAPPPLTAGFDSGLTPPPPTLLPPPPPPSVLSRASNPMRGLTLQ